MNEIQTFQQGTPGTVRTIERIGAEVRTLTGAARQVTLLYAVEIGRRLVEAKALVPHGEWLDWLKRETEFSQPTASRLMRLFEEYGADQGCIFGAETKYSTLNTLSVSKALSLLAVPEEERESFAKEVDAENISGRALEAAIRERDEARKALEEERERRAEAVAPYEVRVKELERAVEDAGPYKERAEVAEARVKELEARPIDVAVQEPDPDEIERRAALLANEAIAASEKEHEAALLAGQEALKAAQEKAKRELAALEEKLNAVEDAGPYKERVKELERKVKEERDKLKKKLEEAEERRRAAEERLSNAGETSERERAEAKASYEAEITELRKQLALSGGEMVAFKLRFAAWQKAYQEMRDALERVPEEQREKCLAAVKAQATGWCA